MSLFWKIFLWFLLGIILITGVSLVVSWTTQREPIAERWKAMINNTMNVYTETTKQIYDNEGEEGVQRFLKTIETSHQNRAICLVRTNNQSCFNDGSTNYLKAVERAYQSSNVEFELIRSEENYAAKKIVTEKGNTYVLVLRIEFPRPPIPFGGDWQTRIFRILAIVLTLALICYALARYLVKPLQQLSDVTRLFADGNLKVRSEIKRRDEIGKLSTNFDEMAERIESLIVSQKRLNRDVSHELRSPLARMNVALEMAKQKGQPEIEPLLNRIEVESFRLNEMISSILTLSKLESGTAEFDRKTISFTKLLKGLVDDSNFEANSKRKSVILIKADECRVNGNENLLRSAVENVLRNAVRYTKDKVEVGLEVKDNLANITVRDYGDGIPESELVKIFRPFHRVSEARDRKSGGIGIGLSITEQAVHLHQGKVTARNLEDGLLVEINLPCERQ